MNSLPGNPSPAGRGRTLLDPADRTRRGRTATKTFYGRSRVRRSATVLGLIYAAIGTVGFGMRSGSTLSPLPGVRS
ncbi:MAG: hypothetical protein ACT4OM_00245 [Actinomycetota bacterium]